MKLSIICFSLTGLETAIRLKTEFEKQGHRVLLASKSKYLKDSIQESVLKWTESRFSADDGILFVGACGIAVRSIAPYVASKKSDPAVLVIDECGKFVISLLSGHLGGANELALTASEILNAQAVVTTATDLHERFAVDTELLITWLIPHQQISPEMANSTERPQYLLTLPPLFS